jgi:glycosyltransferase involved in cell wall biosynthesis
MSSVPQTSIGLYVYNGERFLEEALNSILNQTYSDFELIISDNASTDRTNEIAEAYAKRDGRVRYYRCEKNMGAGWNSRRVYELAVGEYFKWAAADDVLEPDFLRQCVEALEHNPAYVLACSQAKIVDENGNLIENWVFPMETHSIDPEIRFRDMLTWHKCFQIFGVIRMSALRRFPPIESYVHSDRVLLARLSLLGPFYEAPERLFVSRQHTGQSISTAPLRLKQPRFRLTSRTGTLPSLEWWDPTKTHSITFPDFNLILQYLLSIHRAPLRVGQKIRCYLLLLPWIKRNHRRLIKDLLVAADQILYRLQTPKIGSIALKQ